MPYGEGRSMIEAVGLTKRYGAKTAVYNLSFQVRPGTVTGFLGPNGSGKSTTMRMILGLDTPTEGRVTIGGVPYRQLPNAPRKVGALLDAKAVHGGRTARQHLLCLAQLSGIPARRVDEVLGVVGLSEVAGKRSKNFSLGMGQRLGIAGALLGDPEVLLFDEPVNGLDPEGIHWVRNLMRALAAEGRTVFVSSHLMSEMALTADHLVVIGRGQLLADMNVKEFIARNSTSFALVRVPDENDAAERLGKALTAAGAQVGAEPDGALRVTGLPLPRISDLAHEADVRLWELSPHSASLEEAYMRLTNAAVDYRSTLDARQGLQAAGGAPGGWAAPGVPGVPPGGAQPGWGAPPVPGAVPPGAVPPGAVPPGAPAGPWGQPYGPPVVPGQPPQAWGAPQGAYGPAVGAPPVAGPPPGAPAGPPVPQAPVPAGPPVPPAPVPPAAVPAPATPPAPPQAPAPAAATPAAPAESAVQSGDAR
jgi:ABC-2 type transport system ATP-binding protein